MEKHFNLSDHGIAFATREKGCVVGEEIKNNLISMNATIRADVPLRNESGLSRLSFDQMIQGYTNYSMLSVSALVLS